MPARTSRDVSDWQALAELPLRVEGYALERLDASVGGGWARASTVIHLRGGDEEGLGEDVTYGVEDHDALHAAPRALALAGSWTLGAFTEHVSALEQFPSPPGHEVYRRYRNWAFESAALDLALRQAGEPLHAVLGRPPRAVSFVASLRLDEPPTLAPVEARLAQHPTLRFKLDPLPGWDTALIDGLAELDAVATLDFKGRYVHSTVEVPPDPLLYRRLLAAFPDAWIEDPHADAEVEALLRGHEQRVTWDVPIHGVADLDALPFPPRAINVKPSRVGSLRALLELYAACEARAISCYGGGQTELGVGRGQIQYLASLFHPDSPNDVAPREFNSFPLPDRLPASPLAPAPAAIGFRFG